MQKRSIDSVLKEYASFLMALPGVAAIGQGEYEGEPCLKVFVVTRCPELLAQVPQTLAGHPVVVEETGEFTPRGTFEPALPKQPKLKETTPCRTHPLEEPSLQ